MTYDLSLHWVALTIGVLYLLGHLPGVIWTDGTIRFWKAFPRNYSIGAVLTFAAGVWFCWLTATADLGEMSSWRNVLVFAWAIGTVGMILFVPTFLAVRGLAFLLLLGTEVILSAAFFVDSNIRLVMTVTAYAWAITGIVLVAWPYLLRDAFNVALATPARCRWLSLAGTFFGGLLIGLSWFMY